MFTALKAKKFTAFNNLEMEFVPGINVFVGANGTGKTHLLKLMYALQYASQDKRDLPTMGQKLARVFRPSEGQVNRLARRKSGGGHNKAEVQLHWEKELVKLAFGGNGKEVAITGRWHEVSTPVYIPVKEMLSMAPGFRSIYSKYDTQFEEIYADIIDLAYVPLLRGKPDEERQGLLEVIGSVVAGTVVCEGENFFLKDGAGELEITLVAEGMRKLALLSLLIRNGSLQSGTTLFWDEPEANLNPSMMQHVARILLTLGKLGVQIFIATHSYSFLKELELQRAQTLTVRYFSLFTAEGKEGVQVTPADNYAAIEPNLIAAEYTRLYELELNKSLGTTK